MNLMKTSLVVKAVSIAAALACWAGLAFAGPVGELEVQGDVRLTQMGSKQTMTLSNTSYSLFAGDRIVTGDSPASLRLNSGDSLALGPHSEFTLTENGSAMNAELVSGSLAYLLRSESTPLRVNGQQALASGRLRMIQVSDAGSLITLEGSDAESLAAQSGLNVSGSSISIDCKKPGSCSSSRPMSLSP
jgi:hypothetical protein